jgi:hypothetical protein
LSTSIPTSPVASQALGIASSTAQEAQATPPRSPASSPTSQGPRIASSTAQGAAQAQNAWSDRLRKRRRAM